MITSDGPAFRAAMIEVSMKLKKDLAAAGLRCTDVYPVRRGLSPQTYLRLEKA